LAFLVILSTVYVLRVHFSENNTSIENFLSGIKASVGPNRNKNLFSEVLQWLARHYAYTNVLLIPIVSLASYLAFLNTKYNYIQHIILNSFIAGQRIFAFLIILPITYFIPNQEIIYTLEKVVTLVGMSLTF